LASITRQSNGTRLIQFIGTDRARRSIRLGKVPQRAADTLKLRVEHLLAASMTGSPLEEETARWVANLDDAMYERLAAVGLLQKRDNLRLKPFLDSYIESRCDTKPATQITYQNTRRNLVNYFGATKALREITPGDMDEWRLSLVRSGLADNTIRRRCGIAKQFFNAAVRKRLISSNPFAGQKVHILANTSRMYFVSKDEAQRVLDCCPDAQWRLLFALSRYGGLRCPSEQLALRWIDVDWERNRIRVRSPKTEHHPGGESRMVPLFPELLPYLREVFEEAEEGTEFVITRYRRPTINIRTQLMRIIERAGLKPWPKLWQNLRSTRETELAESYPLHVVCAWIGNSQPVAAKHYLQVTDEHFEQAANGTRNGGGLNGNLPSSALQNALQHAAAGPRTASHEKIDPSKSRKTCDGVRNNATQCEGTGSQIVGQRGLEPPTSPLSGARSSQLSYEPVFPRRARPGRSSPGSPANRGAPRC
jgi:integrase